MFDFLFITPSALSCYRTIQTLSVHTSRTGHNLSESVIFPTQFRKIRPLHRPRFANLELEATGTCEQTSP